MLKTKYRFYFSVGVRLIFIGLGASMVFLFMTRLLAPDPHWQEIKIVDYSCAKSMHVHVHTITLTDKSTRHWRDKNNDQQCLTKHRASQFVGHKALVFLDDIDFFGIKVGEKTFLIQDMQSSSKASRAVPILALGVLFLMIGIKSLVVFLKRASVRQNI